MILFRFNCILAVLAVATAYSTAPHNVQKLPAKTQQKSRNSFAAAAATAALAFGLLVGDPQQALASSTAGQISLNSIPPTSVQLDIKDLPVIGNILSGTYTKVEDKSITSPSVSIKSPKDKISAIKDVATGGHLEFDVDGILKTHLDIDIATDKAGVATVKVTSPLIPKLPFKNTASNDGIAVSGKQSDWFKVTNMGTGECYYFNGKTEKTQAEIPKKY
jgi:hypothetical protein